MIKNRYILFLLITGCFSKNFEDLKNVAYFKGSGQSTESKQDDDNCSNGSNTSNEERVSRPSSRTYNTSLNVEQIQRQTHRETFGEYSIIDGRYRSGDELRMERELNEVTPIMFQTPLGYSSLNNFKSSSPPQKRSPSPERWSSNNNNSSYNEHSSIPSYNSRRSNSPSSERKEYKLSDISSEEQSFSSQEEEIYANAEGDEYISDSSDVCVKSDEQETTSYLGDSSSYNFFNSSRQKIGGFLGEFRGGKYYSAEEVKKEKEVNNFLGIDIPNFEEFSLKNNFDSKIKSNTNSFHNSSNLKDDCIPSNQTFATSMTGSVDSFFPTLAVTLASGNTLFANNNTLVSEATVNSMSSANALTKIAENLPLANSTPNASLGILAKEFILFTCNNVLRPVVTSIAGIVSGNPDLLIAAVAAYDYYTNNQEAVDKVLNKSLDEKDKEKVIEEIKKIKGLKKVKYEKDNPFKIDSNSKEEAKKENTNKLNVSNYSQTTFEKNHTLLSGEDFKNNLNSSENRKNVEFSNNETLSANNSYKKVDTGPNNSIIFSENEGPQSQNHEECSTLDNQIYGVNKFASKIEEHIGDSKNASNSYNLPNVKDKEIINPLIIEKIKIGDNLIKITTKDYSFKIFSKNDIKSLENFTIYRKNFKIEKVLKPIGNVIDKIQLFDGAINNIRPGLGSSIIQVSLTGENHSTCIINNQGKAKIAILSESFGIKVSVENHILPSENEINTDDIEDIVKELDKIIGKDKNIKICKEGFILSINESTSQEFKNKEDHYILIYTGKDIITRISTTTGEIQKFKVGKIIFSDDISIPQFRVIENSQASENNEKKSENVTNEEYKSDSSSSDSENEEQLYLKKNKRPKTIDELDKMVIPAVSQLARNVLEKAKEICYQVKDKIIFRPANSGLGYRITIPLNDKRNIVIRIMEKGGKSLFSYFRIAINEAETYTKEGLSSSEITETHIPISTNSLSDIIRIIAKIWGEKWKK